MAFEGGSQKGYLKNITAFLAATQKPTETVKLIWQRDEQPTTIQ